MGLFSRNNKSKDEKYNEEISRKQQEIWNNESKAILEIAVGTHGADEIIAGAMIGETGKLIGMANYGKTKWQPVIVQFFEKGFVILNYGMEVFYDTINSIEVTNEHILSKEFIITTNSNGYLFKGTDTTVDAVILIIEDLKEKYLETLQKEEEITDAEKKENNQSEVNQLIKLGEMHKEGLLSDEEFEKAKKKLL